MGERYNAEGGLSGLHTNTVRGRPLPRTKGRLKVVQRIKKGGGGTLTCQGVDSHRGQDLETD